MRTRPAPPPNRGAPQGRVPSCERACRPSTISMRLGKPDVHVGREAPFRAEAPTIGCSPSGSRVARRARTARGPLRMPETASGWVTTTPVEHEAAGDTSRWLPNRLGFLQKRVLLAYARHETTQSPLNADTHVRTHHPIVGRARHHETLGTEPGHAPAAKRRPPSRTKGAADPGGWSAAHDEGFGRALQHAATRPGTPS